MRRINVFEVEGQWSFAPGTLLRTEWPTMLDAANAAVVYGNTLRGTNAGYVIRLVLPTPNPTDVDSVVIYTHVFSTGPSVRPAPSAETR